MVVTALVLNVDGGKALIANPFPWTVAAVFVGTLAATAVGLVQGLLITGLRLVPFIITLGGLQVVRGLSKGIADNQEISPPSSNWLYQKLMFPVQGQTFNWQLFPLGVWATIVAAVLAAALLRYTKLGRRIYAVGSNEATARLCGVSVQRTKIIVYALAGAFAGLAGVLEFSKLNMGQPTGAQMYELYIIAACVIGGTSLLGGVGTIFGTVVGALIIGTLNAGAQQAGWPKWVQEIVIGAIIIIAVALDKLRTRTQR
jgi:ribose/xylose/arabinose/galactoside ABC-type transport system permease subunit